MPQFDVTAFPSQIFWLVVSFAVLYFLMSKVVLPRIGTIVEDRERKIQTDLDAAQKANDAARAAGTEQDKALAVARTEASQVIREAADAAAAQTTAKMHEIGDKLAAEIGEAERRIAEQRSQALAGLTGMSTEIASAVLTRLVGSADAGQVAQAVDAAAKAGNR
jgi:F-type H+-transporting ATPase subunit b